MKVRKLLFDTEAEMEETITAENYKFSKYIVDQAFQHLTSSEKRNFNIRNRNYRY